VRIQYRHSPGYRKEFPPPICGGLWMNAAENDPAASDGRFNDSGGSVWVLTDNFTPAGKLRTALPILIESWPFSGGDLDHRLARSMLPTHLAKFNPALKATAPAPALPPAAVERDFLRPFPLRNFPFFHHPIVCVVLQAGHKIHSLLGQIRELRGSGGRVLRTCCNPETVEANLGRKVPA
jgi:hypothetical protein